MHTTQCQSCGEERPCANKPDTGWLCEECLFKDLAIEKPKKEECMKYSKDEAIKILLAWIAKQPSDFLDSSEVSDAVDCLCMMVSKEPGSEVAPSA